MVKKAAKAAHVRPYAAGTGHGDPNDVSPYTFQMIRREDKYLEDVLLRLRHFSIRTTDQIYGHLRYR